jgi:hypothetical protein
VTARTADRKIWGDTGVDERPSLIEHVDDAALPYAIDTISKLKSAVASDHSA